MIHILAADLLAVDIIVPLAGNARLEALVNQYHLTPGGKATISELQMNAFADAIARQPVSEAPGGSSANLLTTRAGFLKNEVAIQFLGLGGTSGHARFIRDSLAEAGIDLLPRSPANARAALSYV